MNTTIAEKAQIIRNGGHVRRFHTHHMNRPDSVASHTFGVIGILDLIMCHQTPASMFQAALYHDVPEQKYGDIPSPTKRWMSSSVLAQAEDQFLLDHDLPVVVMADGHKLLLKAADILDGLFCCYDEFKIGNRTLVPVARTYLAYFGEVLVNYSTLANTVDQGYDKTYEANLEKFQNYASNIIWEMVK